ncbi:hypothetical protein BI343_09270 [Chromobacterium amazonense]|nr:hypothetical protein BI343_09270 [Chromobacterium amazonense]
MVRLPLLLVPLVLIRGLFLSPLAQEAWLSRRIGGAIRHRANLFRRQLFLVLAVLPVVSHMVLHIVVNCMHLDILMFVMPMVRVFLIQLAVLLMAMFLIINLRLVVIAALVRIPAIYLIRLPFKNLPVWTVRLISPLAISRSTIPTLHV